MFKIPVDKHYIIHLAENTERKAIIEDNYNKVGLSGYEYWWTSRKPYLNEQIASAIYKDKDTTINIKNNIYDDAYKRTGNIRPLGRVFDCSYTMYTCISVAYARGFNHIAIFEDDVMFIDNPKLVEECFDVNNLPNDYDLVRYYSGAWEDNLPNRFPDRWYIHFKDPEYYESIAGDNNWKGGIFSIALLSRKGMKHFMNFYEKRIFVTDMIYYAAWPELLNSDLNVYVCCKDIIKPNTTMESMVWSEK